MKNPLFPRFSVLIVDDEEKAIRSFQMTLRSEGITNIISCLDSSKVIPILSGQSTGMLLSSNKKAEGILPVSRQNSEVIPQGSDRKVGVMLLDLSMPHVSGHELLHMVKTSFPEIIVIVITGTNQVETAVQCMKSGAFDYMVKPVERNRLITGVRRAIEMSELQLEISSLKTSVLSQKPKYPEAFSEIITQNSAMQSVFKYVEAIAPTNKPVLITGETGVGKELLARAIHSLSNRKGSFVPVNVAGLDEAVFSDTIFGHKRGAFTGADETRKGLIEQAAGGTLFLDEIGDLYAQSQIKLLRLVQEREYYPLGADIAKLSDARLVVATNQDIYSHLKSGKFRRDLYYRLHTHNIHIPPLRKRMDDLPVLVEHFLMEAAHSLGKKKPTPPRELFVLLSTYSFPGNIRELQSIIFNAVSLHKSGKLSLDAFKSYISAGEFSSEKDMNNKNIFSQNSNSLISFQKKLPVIKEATHLLIAEALKRAKGNQTIAAQLLGITRQSLNKRLKNNRYTF